MFGDIELRDRGVRAAWGEPLKRSWVGDVLFIYDRGLSPTSLVQEWHEVQTECRSVEVCDPSLPSVGVYSTLFGQLTRKACRSPR